MDSISSSKRWTDWMMWAWTMRRDETTCAWFARRCAAEVEARMATLRDQLRFMGGSSIREPEAARKKPVASVMAHEDISESDLRIRRWSAIALRPAWEDSKFGISSEAPAWARNWEVRLRASKTSSTLRAVVSDAGTTKLLAATSIGRLEELVTLLRAIMSEFGCPRRIWFTQPHVLKAEAVANWARIHGIELAVRRSSNAKRMAAAG